MSIGDEFTCAMCCGSFEKGQSEEDCFKELDKNLPGSDHNDVVAVCDDCYQKVMHSDPHLRVLMAQQKLMEACGVKR